MPGCGGGADGGELPVVLVVTVEIGNGDGGAGKEGGKRTVVE